MSFIIFVCKYSEHCTLLILDLRCTVLTKRIYMYPNLFQHVVYVKAKYVFYAEDSIKTCPIHYNMYITFIIVSYANYEYAILCKTQNFFKLDQICTMNKCCALVI